MIPPTLSSNALLVLFPSVRNLAFSSSTHFTLRFNFAPISQISQTKLFSSSIDVEKEVDKDDSFTISYLINSCGLSPESAKLASNYLHLKGPSNPDSVLDLLKNYGFSDADIKKVVRVYPKVLTLNAEKNLKPKMEFFLSIGFKVEDLVAIICRTPTLLGSSLNKKIIPFYEFLKKVLVRDELVVESLKKNLYVWTRSFGWKGTNVVRNLELLKKVGVPESRLQFLSNCASGILGYDHAKFSKRINEIISMGFDPLKFSFVGAIRSWPTKSNWERKTQLCRSWGWSDSDISSAFRRNPNFIQSSEEKLNAVMDFLVKKMGWDPSAVGSYVFYLSLEKNIIPKCSVIRVLMLKGLIGEETTLSSFIPCDRKTFLDRFVFKYLEQVPELLDIYEGNVDLEELGFGFKEKLDSPLEEADAEGSKMEEVD